MSRIQIWRPRAEVTAVKSFMVALSLAVSQGGIAATVSAEPRMADSVPSGSTDVEPDPVAAAMDVDGVADEPWLAQAKVVREFVDDMMAKIVAKYPDGERQRTAEPRVPSRVFRRTESGRIGPSVIDFKNSARRAVRTGEPMTRAPKSPPFCHFFHLFKMGLSRCAWTPTSSLRASLASESDLSPIPTHFRRFWQA